MPFFSESAIIAQLAGFCFITFPVWIYFFIFEYKRKGTLGKQWLRLKIISTHNGQLRIYQILIRTIVKFLPWEISHFVIWRFQLPTMLPDFVLYLLLTLVYVIIFVNLFLVLRTKKKQTLYDFFAKTIVIAEDKK